MYTYAILMEEKSLEEIVSAFSEVTMEEGKKAVETELYSGDFSAYEGEFEDDRQGVVLFYSNRFADESMQVKKKLHDKNIFSDLLAFPAWPKDYETMMLVIRQDGNTIHGSHSGNNFQFDDQSGMKTVDYLKTFRTENQQSYLNSLKTIFST